MLLLPPPPDVCVCVCVYKSYTTCSWLRRRWRWRRRRWLPCCCPSLPRSLPLAGVCVVIKYQKMKVSSFSLFTISSLLLLFLFPPPLGLEANMWQKESCCFLPSLLPHVCARTRRMEEAGERERERERETDTGQLPSPKAPRRATPTGRSVGRWVSLTTEVILP